MFVDRVKIFVKAGNGGRGCSSFRREPYVPRGGPDGGVGGPGGHVALVATTQESTLLPLRYHTEFRAERGHHGGPGNRTGRSGEDLLIRVPPGTEARDEATRGLAGGSPSRRRRAPSCAGRARRAWEPRLPFEHESGPPRSGARRDGRGAVVAPRLAAAGRRGLPGGPERREVHLALEDQRGAPEDRRLPVHHLDPRARSGRERRSLLRGRRHSRNHRGRPRGRGARPALPAARRAHAGAPARGRRFGNERTGSHLRP